MSFNVAGDAYNRFMGRFSEPLAVDFAKVADLHVGQRVLDVGCGPGALTAHLVEHVGIEAVSAIDPSPTFVVALGERFPGIDVQTGVAEKLPFPDDHFDAALAELVVHFMTDPVAGLAEMARVTRPGGRVAACVWDHSGGGGGPLTTFWQAVHDIDPENPGEATLPGSREGHLAELFEAAGLRDIEPTSLTVNVRFPTLDDWWEPFTLGVGPAGDYVGRLDEAGRENLRLHCGELLPEPPFNVAASAWCVRGRA